MAYLLASFQESLSFIPVNIAVEYVKDTFDWHQDKVNEVESSGADRIVVSIFKNFMSHADLVSLFVILTQNENDTDDGPN